jgi:hypothetical protein
MRRWLIFLGLVMTALGCGGRVRTVPVSGRVQWNGQPLADARVTFRPDSRERSPGPPSYGKTDADGRFTLRTVDEHNGAVVGPHKVRISIRVKRPGSSEDAAPIEKLPAKYSGDASELRFTVPEGGTKDANFDLRLQLE